jgi:chromosome segregation ATPase
MEALSAQLVQLEAMYNNERDTRQAAMKELQDELNTRRENEVLLTQRLSWQEKLHEQQLAMLKDMGSKNSAREAQLQEQINAAHTRQLQADGEIAAFKLRIDELNNKIAIANEQVIIRVTCYIYNPHYEGSLGYVMLCYALT